MVATSTPLNQTGNQAIEHIFLTYLVRSVEMAIIKSVCKKLQSFLNCGQKILLILRYFPAELDLFTLCNI